MSINIVFNRADLVDSGWDLTDCTSGDVVAERVTTVTDELRKARGLHDEVIMLLRDDGQRLVYSVIDSDNPAVLEYIYNVLAEAGTKYEIEN